MTNRIVKEVVTPRYLSEAGAMTYTTFGRDKIRSWGKEIGAVRKVGKRVVYDRLVIDRAMDALAEAQ